MRVDKLRYRETLSKKTFLEMLRDNVKVTHEENEKLREPINVSRLLLHACYASVLTTFC